MLLEVMFMRSLLLLDACIYATDCCADFDLPYLSIFIEYDERAISAETCDLIFTFPPGEPHGYSSQKRGKEPVVPLQDGPFS